MTPALVMAATVLLYSGRENPRWTLEEASAAALYRAIGAMPAIDCPRRPAPPLGYAGIILDIGRHSWNFRGGVAEMEARCFADLGSRIEMEVVETGRQSIGAALANQILDQLKRQAGHAG